MSGVAIIGIGCRFPGGVTDAASCWALLAEGHCAISEIPADRWSLDGFYDPRPGLPHRSYAKWGGFLGDVDSFDPAFFGITVREAEAMDPQQRLLLHVAYEAVQDARTTLTALREARAGVFIGVSNPDYGWLARHRAGTGDIQAGTGTALSITASRLSHRFDLSGPSMAVDTACSSSLVALDLAVSKLRSGDCDMALAGGVNLLLDPRMFITFCRARMLSATGRIHAFGENADGFVRGEGAGVVLLKRLKDARADGNRIYAVVRATSVNQDGATGTITAPNAAAQADNMRRALHLAEVDPRAVAFAEAHGTGTALGDPAEAEAIGAVFGGAERTAPLLLGSSKANIGHLEPAAGIAGLIKAALSLDRGAMPPMAGFTAPNPAIDFARLGLDVARETAPLPGDRADIFALVNSTGFGGTNACAILQGTAPPSKPVAAPVIVRTNTDPVAVPLSAASEEQLRAWAERLGHCLAPGGPLAETTLPAIAAALAAQRDHFPWRAVVIARGRADLRRRLGQLARGEDETDAPAPHVFFGRAGKRGKLAFAFTGQGGQWWAMGRELIERNMLVRRSIERFDEVFRPAAGWSVLAALLAQEADSPVHDPAVTPAVMFALQSALAKLWTSLGVTPDMVIGHSFGEVTAAHAAGCLSAEQVAPLVNHRGLIRNAIDRKGAMAALGIGVRQLEPLLPEDGRIEISGYNAPAMVTVSGEEAAIDALIAELQERDPGCRAHRLALDFAWHSSWLEPAEAKFKADVGAIAPAPPQIPVVSTVTGRPETLFDTDYWWCNLRRPVRFHDAVDHALDDGAETFIEIGPRRTLSAPIAQCAAARDADVLAVTTLDHEQDARESFLRAVATLYVNGVGIEWAALSQETGNDVALPPLPWAKRKFWRVPEEADRIRFPQDRHPLLGARADATAPAWTNRISLTTHPWLADHAIGGEPVFALACIVEMMRAAGHFVLGEPAIEISHLELPRALVLGEEEMHLRTDWDPGRRIIAIHARADGSKEWTLHARARLAGLKEVPDGPAPERCGGELAPGEFYTNARASGYRYGRAFQRLDHIAVTEGGAWGRASASEPAEAGLALDPGLLDSCLQLTIALAGPDAPAAMPRRVARIVVAGELQGNATGHAVMRGGARAPVVTDIHIRGDGAALLIEGLEAVEIPSMRAAREAPADAPAFYEERFVPLAAELGAVPQPRSWTVLAAPGGANANSLAEALRRRGGTATVIAVDDLDGVAAALPCEGLVYAVPLDADNIEFPDAAVYMHSHVTALIRFAQTRAANWPRVLNVLTRHARALTGEEMAPAGLAQSALVGLVRAIALEYPDLTVRQIDAAACAAPDAIATALAGAREERELAVRGNDIFAPRLQRVGCDGLPPRMMPMSTLGPAANAVLRREASSSGNLVWRETAQAAPGPGEALVAVRAAGLNFRDVMAVTGLLPEGAESGYAAETLGLEFAGEIATLGPGVDKFKVGDRVFGLARGALARNVMVPARNLLRTPETMSDTEAATLPAAWLTARHALGHLARLRSGEKVLIHSGAGGVGLAATALARHAGAEVFATAGTPEKRQRLRDIGVAHVFDSRSLAFADGVVEATGGAGVDVVLNALPGAYIDKGLACLAPGGRFVELGKRDVHDDNALGLKALRRNISFHVVDLAAMLEDRPEHLRRLMGEVLTLMETGAVAPLPVTSFPAREAEAAFSHFAAARHIGKIAIDMAAPDTSVRADAAAPLRFDAGGSYLVTGGTRGFGLSVARWLAKHGAGRIVLASKSGAPPSPDTLEDLRRRIAVDVIALDLADKTAVRTAILELAEHTLPLRGIVHAATVYADAPLAGMDEDRISSVLAAKAQGALNLTAALLEAELHPDFFVTFSSATAVTGWPNQTNYAAANALLPALARYQRARGLRGIALALGALGESGHVARAPRLAAYLENAGWTPLSDAAALAALGSVLASDAEAPAFMGADWARLAARHAPLAAPRLAALTEGDAEAHFPLAAELAGCNGATRAERAERIVRREIARVLRAEETALAGFATLDDAGLDSLSSLELRNRLETALGLTIPLGRFTLEHEIAGLAKLVCALVAETEGADAGEAAPARRAAE